MQPFLFRQDLNYPVREEVSVSQSATWTEIPAPWRQAMVWGAVGLGAAALALWPTVRDMVGLWNAIEAYQYAWLVLPMLVYLLGWHYRNEVLALTPTPGCGGGDCRRRCGAAVGRRGVGQYRPGAPYRAGAGAAGCGAVDARLARLLATVSFACLAVFYDPGQ